MKSEKVCTLNTIMEAICHLPCFNQNYAGGWLMEWEVIEFVGIASFVDKALLTFAEIENSAKFFWQQSILVCLDCRIVQNAVEKLVSVLLLWTWDCVQFDSKYYFQNVEVQDANRFPSGTLRKRRKHGHWHR